MLLRIEFIISITVYLLGSIGVILCSLIFAPVIGPIDATTTFSRNASRSWLYCTRNEKNK